MVETSTLQRAAYNRAFAELGIDFEWGHADYAASLSDSGGRNCLTAIAFPDGARLNTAQIAAVHTDKTRAFDAMLADTVLPLRAGVANLVARAKAAGVALTWAASISQTNFDALLRATGDAITCNDFAFIGNDRVIIR